MFDDKPVISSSSSNHQYISNNSDNSNNSNNNHNLSSSTSRINNRNQPPHPTLRADTNKQGTASSSDSSAEEEEEEEEFIHIGSPIAVMWYDFLMHPQSSLYATIWALVLCSLVALRIFGILLESCNGPNEYYHRAKDEAHYPFLLTEPQYFQLYIACFTPILFDSAMRLVLVLLITFETENYPVYQRFVADPTEVVMFFCDIICVIPFLVSAISLAPDDFLSLSQASSITLSILELLMTVRIFRYVRNIPAVRAVSIALTNSFEHLVVPLFFFFAFNITAGVFFYFSEPCYNVDVCPWTSVFQSSFFAVVTMTTTGYGNQTPAFMISRFVAIITMLFGSLYLSMPLAIIGNEYDKAWTQIHEEIAADEWNQQQQQQQQLGEGTVDAGKANDQQAASNTTEKSGIALTPSSSVDKKVSGFALIKSNSADKRVTFYPLTPSGSTERKGFGLIKSNSVDKKAVETHGNPMAYFSLVQSNSVDRKVSPAPTPPLSVHGIGQERTVADERGSMVKKTLATSIEDKRQRVKTSAVMVIRHSLVDKLHHLHADYKAHSRFISPSVMIGLCELRAWLPTLVLGIEEVLRSIALFESRLPSHKHEGISTPSHSRPTSAAHAAAPRRYSVIGRGGALITRSLVNTAPITSAAHSAGPTVTHSSSPAGLPAVREVDINEQKNSAQTLSHLQIQRRHSHNQDKQDDENDDEEEESDLGSLGSFAFSSEDLDDEEDEEYQSNNNHHQQQHHHQHHHHHAADSLQITTSVDKAVVPPSGHISSSMDSSSQTNSQLSTSFRDLPINNNNPIPLEQSTPAAALPLKPINLVYMNNPNSNYRPLPLNDVEHQIPEENSGSDSESGHEDSKKANNQANVNLTNSSAHSSDFPPSASPPREPNKESTVRSSMFDGEEYLQRRRARTSMYNRLITLLKSNDPELRRRSLSEEAVERLKAVAANPTELRNRLWILLEFPHSSKEARALQILLIFLICLSIFIMFTQTVTSLTSYGESRPICGNLLELYCWDKDDSSLDPGCFVQNINGPTTSKLQFNCGTEDCFANGLNFGSGYTNMTCVNATTTLPFQTTAQLNTLYPQPWALTSRNMMQRISAICSRIECIDNTVGFYDAGPMWVVTEFIMNIIFIIELLLRITVAQSITRYIQDLMNWFDLLAILPFFLSIVFLNQGSVTSIDFSILASSPYDFSIVLSRSFLVFRLFKLTRHFRASKVLVETAAVIWKQIAGMLALMVLMVLLFSIILYELEKGRACYVGDPDCTPPASIAGTVQVGDLIYIGKSGLPSQIPNIFYGVWFCFVSATTTGYGDIVPVTNGGQLMAIFLMVFGTFYMAMPLTAAATTFYTVHEKYSALGTVAPLDRSSLPQSTEMMKESENKENEKEEDQNEAATSIIPSFLHSAQPVPAHLPPRPLPPKTSILSENMQLLIQATLRELRSFDRLIEEVITDLHSSPICFFDESLMRQEERKHSINSDNFSNLDDFGGSLKSSASVSTIANANLNPPRQLQRMRKKIARLCKGLEDAIRSNEPIVVDILFLYHAILHGEIE